jgi:hypothetical protein
VVVVSDLNRLAVVKLVVSLVAVSLLFYPEHFSVWMAAVLLRFYRSAGFADRFCFSLCIKLIGAIGAQAFSILRQRTKYPQ